MRIAYRFRPDSDFVFRGVMRACFRTSGEFCRLSLTDVAVLSAIVAIALWFDVSGWAGMPPALGAIVAGAMASAGIAVYMIGRIVFRAARAVLDIRPRLMPVDFEIELGEFVRSMDKSEETYAWASMTSAEKFDDMYVVKFRVSPAGEVPVLIPRAHLEPHEDAALEQALAPKWLRKLVGEPDRIGFDAV